jgi:Ca2+/Na+ antiporter
MNPQSDEHAAGEATSASTESGDHRLRRLGVDPARLAIHRLGWPRRLLWHGYPPWVREMMVGLGLWAAIVPIEALGWELPALARTIASLVIGLLVLKAACDALVTATERLAARQQWDHYVAGTLSEIVSTLPELVVICFVIPVSPLAAMVIALVTIYNNAFVFSVYSYFLPKNQRGRFLMPKAITEVGTQILIAGAGLGSVIGLVMLALSTGEHSKQAFSPIDLGVLAMIMLAVFGVYLYVLIQGYASEEETVRRALDLDATQIEQRRERAYGHVKRTSVANIAWLFAAGVAAAFVGGERVSEFARTAIQELSLNPIAAAVVLAAFAGMSEYVILWRAHRKGQYRIALANAFGGITQVMFLVLPLTLLAISIYEGILEAEHRELPLTFTVSNVLLFVLLFPTFYVLIALIEEDHTLGALDTTIMASIFFLVILILIGYGGV